MKCVTETKNISVLFYINFKSSFLHYSHTFNSEVSLHYWLLWSTVRHARSSTRHRRGASVAIATRVWQQPGLIKNSSLFLSFRDLPDLWTQTSFNVPVTCSLSDKMSPFSFNIKSIRPKRTCYVRVVIFMPTILFWGGNLTGCCSQLSKLPPKKDSRNKKYDSITITWSLVSCHYLQILV